MRKSVAYYIGSRYAALNSPNQLVGFISLLTVLGLVLGVAILITVLSVMNGFDRELQQRILGLVPHLTVTTPRGSYLRTVEEWEPVRSQILQTPGVLNVAPYMQLQGMVIANGRSKGVLLNGIDPAVETKVSIIDKFITSGSLASLQADAYQIAIGANLAEQLQVKVGDEVMLVTTAVEITPMGDFQRKKTFKVGAIFAVGSQLDSSLALTNLAIAQKLYRLDKRIHGYRVQVADLFQVQQVAQHMIANLPSEQLYTPWTDSYGTMYDNIRISKTLVGLLLTLLVAVAAFNVVVSLMMVVREKQGDIAILRTLGAATTTIRNIFLTQGLFIGLLGTAGGVVLGLILSLSISEMVAGLQSLTGVQLLSADVYPVNYLPSELRVSDVLLVSALAIALSLLATIFPARKAARSKPAEILRYE